MSKTKTREKSATSTYPSLFLPLRFPDLWCADSRACCASLLVWKKNKNVKTQKERPKVSKNDKTKNRNSLLLIHQRSTTEQRKKNKKTAQNVVWRKEERFFYFVFFNTGVRFGDVAKGVEHEQPRMAFSRKRLQKTKKKKRRRRKRRIEVTSLSRFCVPIWDANLQKKPRITWFHGSFFFFFFSFSRAFFVVCVALFSRVCADPMVSQDLFVSISGMIGAGKTTLATSLAKELNVPVYYEKVFLACWFASVSETCSKKKNKQTNKQTKNRLSTMSTLPTFIRTWPSTRFSFKCTCWITDFASTRRLSGAEKEQCRIVQSTRTQSLPRCDRQKKRRRNLLICSWNRFFVTLEWWRSEITARTWGLSWEKIEVRIMRLKKKQSLFSNMSNFMRKPNLLVHLEVTPEESMARIKGT